LEVQVVGVSS